MQVKPVTLITGASRGIGRFLVHHYVEQGHQVIGCSRKVPDWQLDGFVHRVADVSNEQDVKVLFEMLSKEYGILTNLVNNAGIAAMNHALLTPLTTVQQILNTNVVGTFLFCREAARLMQRQKYGRIVNVGTVAVPLRVEGEAIYAASKAAVISLTQILAKEFAPFGITVNAVGPTPIDTDLIRRIPRQKIESLMAQQAIRQQGTFDDIANVIDFFLSPRSSFITGQTIYLGGI